MLPPFYHRAPILQWQNNLHSFGFTIDSDTLTNRASGYLTDGYSSFTTAFNLLAFGDADTFAFSSNRTMFSVAGEIGGMGS